MKIIRTAPLGWFRLVWQFNWRIGRITGQRIERIAIAPITAQFAVDARVKLEPHPRIYCRSDARVLKIKNVRKHGQILLLLLTRRRSNRVIP